MENEKDIALLLQEISDRMQAGFDGLAGQIDGLERRIEAQEKQSRKVKKRQERQEGEIEQLKEIVSGLARTAGCRKVDGGTAIKKESAYSEFEEKGFSRRKAMKELKEAGAIRTDCEGKATCAVRVDGRIQRLIVVCDIGEEQA